MVDHELFSFLRDYFKDLNFFEDINPFLTISYRGYIQAWVYRGDQIKHKVNKNICKKYKL
jgi:hypothetical protein